MFRPPKPVDMTLNLAPMVDVMMCLIIFFLLASNLVSAEQKKVHLPDAVAAREVKTHELGERVTINVVKPEGAPADVAEFVVADWDGRQIIERTLKPADVETLLRARALAAARDGQTIRCVIRADSESLYQHVEIVLRACGLAKISDVVFAATKSEGGA